MKKTILLLSIFALIGTATQSFKNSDEKNVVINTKVSTIDWIGKKVTGQHTGNISIKEGSLSLKNGEISSGKVIVDMESITCTDLDGEWGSKLIGHLNSPDFFDVANNKTATLDITQTKKTKGQKYIVTGTLTIKGISKPIEFPATIEVKDGKLAAFAEVSVDRTLYDIKYGSGKFFEGLGDKMIDDHFIVKFKIAAE
jgi:polyisoprenoid-binding protein YceI